MNDRLLNKTRVFDLRAKLMRFPNGKTEDDFYYIDTVDWVNVIPITEKGEVIFVKQFRHGIDAATLETPGGLVDTKSTEPFLAARRELAEETGYESDELILIGSLHPNPAMLNNRVHIYAALNARPTAVQDLEPTEDITLHKYPLNQISQLFQEGILTHSVTAAAFYLLLNKLPELTSKYTY